MLRSMRTCKSWNTWLLARPAGVLFLVGAVGGCSADLGRFDFPSAGYAPDGARSSTNSIPTPSEPMRRNAGIPTDRDVGNVQTPNGGSYERGYDAPRSRAADYERGRNGDGERRDDYSAGAYGSDRRAGEYGNGRSNTGGGPSPGYDGAPTRTYAGEAARPNQQMASLPPQQREPDARISDAPRQTDRAFQRPTSGGPNALSRSATPGLRTTQPPASSKGESLEVQPGDTLSSISRQYRVSVAELMKLNNLDNPNLRPGQRIVLPAGRRPLAQRAPAAPAQTFGNDVQAGGRMATGGEPAATPMQSAAVSTSGTHTVQAGESLYSIARKLGVKPAELQAANSITDVTKIKPGTVLKIPGAGSQAQASAPTRVVRTTTVMSDAAQPETRTQGETSTLSVRPKIINGDTTASAEPKRVAALGADEQTSSDASAAGKGGRAGELSDPPKLAGTGKFRWPAKGKIIAGFGQRPDKSHNDGINISVPQGTEVLAAESGVVAYAGNEIKGYGNLVLIRHESGWVSAYAHGEELLVKRGDKVRRGQAIAKAGNTGAVDQPQVHFELRQDSRPVDPMPHMEK